MWHRLSRWPIVLLLSMGAGAAPATDDPCAGFQWDIGRERALFASAAEPVAAGTDAGSAPRVVPDRLYELTITPQAQVAFQVPPGKKVPVEGASAGLARLRLVKAGKYRISLDQSFWIDVVADNHLVAADDFQGRPGCRAPHKIVLYSLPGGQELILQLSSGIGSSVRIAIVPVPDASPGN